MGHILTKSKRGAQRKVIVTPEFLKEVETLGLRGLKMKFIHAYFNVGHSAWYEALAKHPEISEAIKRGRSRGVSLATGKLMELVKKGDKQAIMFYLKSIGEFSEHEPAPKPPKKPKVDIPDSLGTMDSIEASKIYQSIMLSEG